jgi:hypothetical protein
VNEGPVAAKTAVGAEEKAKAAVAKEPAEEAAKAGMLSPGLLRDERVRKELSLNQKQLDRLKKIHDEVAETFKADLAKAKEAARDEDPRKRILFNYYRIQSKMIDAQNAAVLKALPDMLKDDQLKRLEEISLQHRGVRAFLIPAVAKKLKLTAEQKKQIDAIADKTIKEVNKPTHPGAPGGYVALDENTVRAREKMLAVAVKKVVVDVLSEEQEKVWKEMLGKHLDLKWAPTKPRSGKKEE